MGSSPEFSTPAVVLSIPLFVVLILDPLLGKRMYDRLEQRRDHDDRALKRSYWRIIGLEWSFVAIVALIIAVSPGARFSQIGLALPTKWFDAAALPLSSSALAGMAFGLLVVGAAGWLVARKARTSGVRFGDGYLKLQRANLETFKGILPRTADERRLAVAVSVTAGICEELVYRGFLIGFGVGVFGLDPYVAGGLAVLFFGLAHLYQGWLGTVRVTLVGIILTGLYLGTGSLVVPILLHAVMDIVSLVFAPRFLRTDRPIAHDKTAQTVEAS
ncbi:CPBP family intramembrane glutamic endopeptidase [Amycolatopsis taiwanensis]|nr:CPBP family intramembrane glutamic endopeptidase [Amycolatopsis taiwanensis]